MTGATPPDSQPGKGDAVPPDGSTVTCYRGPREYEDPSNCGLETAKGGEEVINDGSDAVGTGDEGATRVPDGGWGWLVVFGSFIITMLVPLLGPCFGVLFSRYLLEVGSSSVTTAWIFNTQCFIWNMMGLVVRPLAKEFGWRNVAIFGILLTSVSVVISAFTPSAEFLFFSFSLLSGVGGGVVVCMSFIIVPMYFDQRRGVANALMMAGVCTGQIVGPPFVRLLQDEYGFKGATLILGAIMLNGLVGAAFFHPVEWHMKPARQDTTEALPDTSAPLIQKVTDEVQKDGDTEKTQSSLYSGNSKEGSEWTSLGPREGSVRENGECATYTDKMELSLSSLDPSGLGAAAESDVKKSSVGEKGGRGLVRVGVLLVRVARSTVTDLGIFRSPRAVIIAFGCTFFINGYYNFIMMVPFAMQAADHTLADSAWCISASAVCNLVARMLISSLSDCSWFNMRVAYMTGLATTATSTLVFPFLREVRWLMVAMAVWGSGVGTTMGLYNLVMVRFMGVDNLAPVFGAASLTVGIGFLTLGPLIGVIRDASGSYAVSMWVLSGAVTVSFILWLFMPAAQAYDQCRAAKHIEEEGSSEA